MAFKTNYGQQRAERDRLKQARRREKLEQKRARTSQQGPREADHAGDPDAADAPTSDVPQDSRPQ